MRNPPTTQECLRILLCMIDTPRTIVPDLQQAYALEIATTAMVMHHSKPRDISIIRYHALNPEAIICRDTYTMAAMREAAAALEHMYKEERKNGR